jgi:predicted membrane channel-forming protein YqfA (hemolysin III family)
LFCHARFLNLFTAAFCLCSWFSFSFSVRLQTNWEAVWSLFVFYSLLTLCMSFSLSPSIDRCYIHLHR